MSLRRKTLLLFVSIVCLIMFLSGCEIYTKAAGGGWIPSATGLENEKATFGFTVQIDPETEAVKGHVQFIDHGTGQKFIAPLSGCVEEGFTGKTNDGLDVYLQVGNQDGNDWLQISVYEGPDLVYFNDAAIQGGNINFK